MKRSSLRAVAPFVLVGSLAGGAACVGDEPASTALDAGTSSGSSEDATTSGGSSGQSSSSGAQSSSSSSSSGQPSSSSSGSNPIDAACVPVSLAVGGFVLVGIGESPEEEYGTFKAPTTPAIVDASDRLYVEIYAAREGTISLDALQAQYGSCTHCVILRAGSRQFLAQSGTLLLQEASDAFSGSVDGSLTDVKLAEVTIDGNGTSLVVEGGACYSIASATLSVP